MLSAKTIRAACGFETPLDRKVVGVGEPGLLLIADVLGGYVGD